MHVFVNCCCVNGCVLLRAVCYFVLQPRVCSLNVVFIVLDCACLCSLSFVTACCCVLQCCVLLLGHVCLFCCVLLYGVLCYLLMCGVVLCCFVVVKCCFMLCV